MQEFVLISELKKRAYKKSILEQNPEKPHTVIQQFIGINNVNKEWLEEAISKYNKSLKQTGFQKIHTLQLALVDIYCCEYAMNTSTFQDKDVLIYKDKIENAYNNLAMEYIETFIHNEKAIISHHSQLSSAVSVLEESNSKIAAQYRIMLNRQQSLLQSVQKIQKTLDNSPLELTDQHFLKISNILKLHENALRLSPGVKEELLEEIRSKIDVLLLHFQKMISEEESLAYPSVFKILAYFDEFEKLYQPFINILSQKRYPDFISKKEKYSPYTHFLNNQYPELKEAFQYFSLPRKTVDKSKLISLVQSAEKHLYLQHEQYIEFRELNPSLQDIIQRFSTLLSYEYKDDLLKYYKLENDINNAEDDEEKLNEIIRLAKHLEQKLSTEKNNYLSNKLKIIRENLLKTLDNSILKFLRINVPKSNRIEQIKESFDYVLNKLYELSDLARIEEFQKKKRGVLSAIVELDDWIAEIKDESTLYASLPDSNLKYNLKLSLEEKLAKINDVLPLINQYNLYDINELINTITMVLNVLNINAGELPITERLVILDQFTVKNYVVLTKKTVFIGRDEQNDIVLNCGWISGSHCSLDQHKSMLMDLNSTNGTYYNQNQKVDMPIRLENIQTFNLAEAMEFELTGFKSSYHFKLKRITDHQVFKDPTLKDFIQNLFNTEFIWLKDGDSFSLNKITGVINDSSDLAKFDNIEIAFKNYQFLISDPKQKLIEVKISSLKEESADRFSFHIQNV